MLFLIRNDKGLRNVRAVRVMSETMIIAIVNSYLVGGVDIFVATRCMVSCSVSTVSLTQLQH